MTSWLAVNVTVHEQTDLILGVYLSPAGKSYYSWKKARENGYVENQDLKGRKIPTLCVHRIP